MIITEFPTVCQEWIDGELNLDVVITGPPRKGDCAYFGVAWRNPGEPWTFSREGGPINVFNREDPKPTVWGTPFAITSAVDLRPHPDADRVWADYCAAMLTR